MFWRAILVSLIMLILAVSVFGQAYDTSWVKVYPGNITGFKEAFTVQGGGNQIIVSTQYTWGPTNTGIYVVKTDAWGDTVWTRVFDSDVYAYHYEGWDVTVNMGGYVIAGFYDEITPRRGLLFSVSENGDSLGAFGFSRSQDWLIFTDIENDAGGYIVCGQHSSSTFPQACLYKIDVNGNEVWSVSYGGNRTDSFDDVEVLSDGSGYIAVGRTDSYGQGCPDPWGNYFHNVYLMKTDLSGNIQWQNAFGGEGHDYGYRVIETSDSCFLVVGENQSVAEGSSGYMVKVDQSGNAIWERTYHNDPGTWGWVRFHDVTEHFDGYMAIGQDAYDHLYFIATDDIGDTVWTDTLNIGTNEYARMIWGDEDQYLVTGGVKIGPSANPYQPFLLSYMSTTGIDDRYSSLPEGVALNQNYPNPFNAFTKISYSLNKTEHVRLELYDLLGRKVSTLVDEFKPTGEHSVKYDASSLSSGVYFYKLSVGDGSETRRMLLVK